MKQHVIGHEPEEVSPQTHVFVGTFRPPFLEIHDPGVGMDCDVCQARVRDSWAMNCWIKGHVDQAVYRRIEDLPAKENP